MTRTKAPAPRLSAQDLAKKQREISVAEFFAKNRHLLGYDNAAKALLTAVREAVDNALDACEEAQILPDLKVEVAQVKAGTRAPEPTDEAEAAKRAKGRAGPGGTADRFRIAVEDNGPGIVRQQIGRIFGKLLYGSKFHRLRMSRGQQGIGISAAALYGQLTTGRPIRIVSRTGPKHPAHLFELHIDTQANEPRVLKETEDPTFAAPHGTRVELELEGKYVGGAKGIHEYLRQTALANPHASIRFTAPGEASVDFERAVEVVPEPPREIQPHPYGVELGTLIKMLASSSARRVSGMLQEEFCRVSPRVAAEILKEAGLPPDASPKRVARDEAENLYRAMSGVKVMAPPTDCLTPIGEPALLEGMKKEVEAAFYTATSRAPAVYRGNPFLVEAALAYGPPLPLEEPARLFRFANRVPLLHQQGACAITKAAISTSWRSYDLQHPKGSLPIGPLAILVHIASVWVPFTSESKEAVASYDEIHREIRLALQEVGRKVGAYVSRHKRLADAEKKTSYITRYLPTIAEALRDLLALDEPKTRRLANVLEDTLRKSRSL
jgi:DNA topoisomerase-6 subunit B